MDAQTTVNAGDFYSQKLKYWNSHHLVWRVKSVSNTAMDMPHAQLINIRDPFETRTISCRILTNAAFYERLDGRTTERPVAAAAKSPKLKRVRAGHAEAASSPRP